MKLTHNYIETKIIYENEFETEHDFYLQIETMFVDHKNWKCINAGRMKSGIKYYLFVKEVTK